LVEFSEKQKSSFLIGYFIFVKGKYKEDYKANQNRVFFALFKNSTNQKKDSKILVSDWLF
jgi:hypothetical protein